MSNHPTDSPKSNVGPKRLPVLLAGLLAGTAFFGCSASNPAPDGSQKASNARAPGLASATGAGAGETGRHLVGDYDSDDGRHLVNRTDGDTDDLAHSADKDNDADQSSSGQYDRDDTSVRDFGRSASSGARRAIEALVKRYYDAAAVGDGAKACSLFFSPLAVTYPKDLAEGSARPYLRGLQTCAQVASKLFEQYRAQVSATAAMLKVASIRLAGDLGLVVLRLGTRPSRQIEVRREHGAWKMYALLDSELP